MPDRTPEELARALQNAERRAAELQAWVDASETDAERAQAELTQLRSRVKELESRPVSSPSTSGEKAVAELQQWLDASEAEVEQLRAKVEQLESRAPVASSPSTGGEKAVAELQQWLDASEAEVEQLRAKVEQLESRPPVVSSPSTSGEKAVAELQQWLDASEAEAEELRAEVEELKQKLQTAKKVGEERTHVVEDQLHSSQIEADALRTRVIEEEKHARTDAKHAGELQQWLEAAELENEELRATIAQLESTTKSLREMNKRFGDQAEANAQRDVARLRAELEEARTTGAPEKVGELESLLENAREAISLLETERSAAIEQVQRYTKRDQVTAERKVHDAHAALEALKSEKDARIAVLQHSLSKREEELKTLEARLHAYATSEREKSAEVEQLRMRECESREQLGQVRVERGELQSAKNELTMQVATLSAKLSETKQWLETSEKECEDLARQLEGAKVDGALRNAELSEVKRKAEAAAAAAAKSTSSGVRSSASSPAHDGEPQGDELEGFSVARLHRLEALLAAEKLRSTSLKDLVEIAEKSAASMREALEAARGKLADVLKRLGLNDEEFGEVLERLDVTRTELHALKQEFERARNAVVPPPPPLDAFDEPVAEEDVLSAPLDAMGALAETQAVAAQQATQALAGEQRAREQLLSDLNWLRAEFDKMSHVRDDLRARLAELVQRELKRKGVVASLLERLRVSEVATAARVGAVRRLQAAIELAQRNAVKVQTIYFQKQIGSLQRQLETALGKKRAAAPAPVSLRAAVNRR